MTKSMSKERTSFTNILHEVCLDFLFPRTCLVCENGSLVVCESCEKNLGPPESRCIVCSRKNPLGSICAVCKKPTAPNHSLAIYKYEGICRDLVHLFKYNDVTDLKHFFAEKLATHIRNIDNFNNYHLSYIPLSRSKKRLRGYNQSELLCKEVAKILKVPFTGLLTRVDVSRSQALSQTKLERKRNVKGIFKAKLQCPEYVILIDDVTTTGL